MSRYLEILFRFWIRFVLLLVVMPALVAGAFVVFFPSYKATSALWVDYPTYFGARFTPVGWNQYLTPAQNESDSLTQLMSTTSFVGTLTDRLAASGTVTDPVERRSVIGSIYTTLRVNATGSHLMVLSVSCDRKAVCVAILNETIALFRDQETKLEQDQADIGISFLSSELTQAQASQKAAEDALSKYLAANPSLRADPTTAAAYPELARLMADLQTRRANVAELQVSLSQAEYLSSASARLVEIGPRVMDAPHISNDGLLGDGQSLKRALVAAAVCIAIGAAYLVLLTWLDKTARDTRELERRLKVRVITSIDKMRQLEHLAVE